MLTACEVELVEDQLKITGVWVNQQPVDNKFTYQRAETLVDNEYYFAISSNGKFTEHKNSGFAEHRQFPMPNTKEAGLIPIRFCIFQCRIGEAILPANGKLLKLTKPIFQFYGLNIFFGNRLNPYSKTGSNNQIETRKCNQVFYDFQGLII